MEELKEWWDVYEAAAWARLSHWTIRGWLRDGKLTRYRIGGRVLISRSELASLIKSNK